MRGAQPATVGNAPSIQALAAAALAVLAREGKAESTDRRRARFTGASGIPFDVSCDGPDLPAAVPAVHAPPALIPTQRPWIGRYRLIVLAPLIVLDLYWNPDEPMRIMSFSRGDWERDIITSACV